MKVSGQLQSLAALPHGNNSQTALKWRLNESQSQSWLFGKIAYPCQVTNNDAQFLETHSLVTMLTKLSWLRHTKLNSQDLRFSASIFTAHVVLSLGPWRMEEVPWKYQYFFLPLNAVFYPTRLYSSKKLLTSSPFQQQFNLNPASDS